MRLTSSQEAILKAYAKECHPKIPKNPDDWYFLTEQRFIQPQQDHITDKGLAYVVAEMGYSFTKFISDHHWKERLGIFIDFAKRVFHSKEELDIYFRAKYRANLKYETWGPNGQEQQLPPEQLKKFTAEMFLSLLQNPEIDWKKIRGLFKSQSPEFYTFFGDRVETKEQFVDLLQEFLKA